jgi:site-specific DNA-methyltransferase (adenine-specific)
MKRKANMANIERFRMPESDFVNEIATTIVPDITTDELTNFDDSSFDIGLDIDIPLPSTDELRTRLNDVSVEVRREEPVVEVIEQQSSLFPDLGMMEVIPESGSRFHFEVSRKRFASLIPLVIQAFVDIRDGWSADYILLNPEKDLDFLQRCWRLGAVAAPEELNWTLMNARKDGKLKGLVSERSFGLSKADMDRFSFAAEMAMRELQERARIKEQRENVSLDKLLCSPRLSGEFDVLAKQIAPGFSSLQYRWAAMALRKARRLAKALSPMPLFDELGILSDVKPSQITTDGGVFWVCSENHSAFVGVAENLRVQIDSFIERLGESATPAWVADRPTSAVRIRVLPMSAANRNTQELMRSSILRRQGSRLNFKDASLFGGLLNVA